MEEKRKNCRSLTERTDQVPKIVFFDIDGTLVDMETGVMTQTVKTALEKLQEQGIRICLATGRGPSSIPDFGIAFDAVISFNGSLCTAGTTRIAARPIPADDVKKVMDNAARLGRPVALADDCIVAASGADQDLRDYFAIARKDIDAAPGLEVLKEDIFQIMAGCTLQERELLVQDAPGARLAAWWDRAADIIPAGSGKGQAVQAVLDCFGLKAEEAAAFGDGSNDIEMLEAAGRGIAMGNASADLLAAADEVCLPVSQDGVACWLQDHVFDKLAGSRSGSEK